MKAIKKTACILAFTAAALFTAACSSDDEGDNGGKTSSLPQITATISANDDDGEARGMLTYNNNKQLKEFWFADDYIWAYSPSKKFFNKLIPVAGQKFGSTTAIKFVSTGNVDYTVGEQLVLFYCGNKQSDAGSSGVAALNPGTVKFARTDNDPLAIICGNYLNGADAGDKRAFSDNGNTFYFKATNMTVDQDGTLSKSKEWLRAYMPMIRIGIPAADVTTDAGTLAKLQYKITVAATTLEQETEGYPASITYKIKDNLTDKTAGVLTYPENDIYTWGSPYTVTLTPGNTNVMFKSESLWNNRGGNTIYKDNSTGLNVDYAVNGYVFIPLPSLNYTKLKVTVEVSDPDNAATADNSLSALLGTYSYERTSFIVNDNNESLGANDTGLSKNVTNLILNLGNIWTRGSYAAGGKWQFDAAAQTAG